MVAAKITRTVPPLPATERGAFCHISTDFPGERILYCNGSNVLWRGLASLEADAGASEKPEDIFCWRGHSKKTTCVAMGPNSQWVVSGDVTGAVRVWGAKGDHVLKNEYKLWDGTVKDVCWSGDSTRISAAGDGKEVRAASMIWDTGSKTGEVAGHTKQINSISFKSQRPFRVITGGEDRQVAFHQGPPFKYAKGHTLHTNFVNCVRFSPDGTVAFSAGSDSKLVLYDNNGELLKEFESPEGICGSIWAGAWSPDSKHIVTAGGDKKVRVWNAESAAQVFEVTVGEGALEDMQAGVAWPSQTRIITICLDGRILLWEWDGGEAPKLKLAATIDGTQGSLSCLVRDPRVGAHLWAGGDGVVASSSPGQTTRKTKIGKSINGLLAHSEKYAGEPEVWLFALDEIARTIASDTCVVKSEVKLGELAIGSAWLDPEESRAVVATSKNSLICIRPGEVAWSLPNAVPRRPTAIGSSPSTKRLAVGLERPDGMVTAGVPNQQYDIQLFNIDDGGETSALSPGLVLSGHLNEITAIKFNETGDLLASADAGSKVFVRNLAADGAVMFEWGLHNARVTCLDWLAGGRRLVSGSLDQQLIYWDVDKPKEYVKIPDAHKGGVAAVAQCGESSFASVGNDGFVHTYEIS